MVERPIKKSERQAVANTEEADTALQPSGERPPKPQRRQDREDSNNRDNRDSRDTSRSRDKNRKKGGKKRGNREEEDFKPPVNPALVRGPRPAKAAPLPEPEAVEETTDVSDEQAESASIAETEAAVEDSPVDTTA